MLHLLGIAVAGFVLICIASRTVRFLAHPIQAAKVVAVSIGSLGLAWLALMLIVAPFIAVVDYF